MHVTAVLASISFKRERCSRIFYSEQVWISSSLTCEDKGSPMEKVLAETRCSENIDEKDGQKNFTRSLGDDAEKKIGGEKVEEKETSGDVNMEASITADDVIRAGGFGARDDISSFLPVASDSTDFEASIRNARDYEEPQEQVSRPGLGWTAPTTTKGE